MRETDVWKNASDAEFDNSLDAMEKLVMNRLYDLYAPLFRVLNIVLILHGPSTFTPQIDRQHRPIMADDLERDHVLRQRIKLFGWIEESHLDIPTGEGSGGFVMFAEQGRCVHLSSSLNACVI